MTTHCLQNWEKKTRISLKDDNSRQTVAHPCNGRQIGQHEMNF